MMKDCGTHPKMASEKAGPSRPKPYYPSMTVPGHAVKGLLKKGIGGKHKVQAHVRLKGVREDYDGKQVADLELHGIDADGGDEGKSVGGLRSAHKMARAAFRKS